MTIFGIGDKAGKPTFIYLAITIALSIFFSVFHFPNTLMTQSTKINIGITLLVIGVAVLVLAGGHLVYAYRKGILAKTGFFRLVANPLYANWVVFIIPGLALLLDSWLVLTSSIVLYVIYRRLVHEEYDYLREKFGKEYEDYYKSIIIKWL